MMLVFLFALAVGVMSSNAWDYADFAEATEDCSKPTEEVCNLREFALRKFNLDCKTAVETLECIIQVEEKCHFDEHFLGFAKQSLDKIKYSCRYAELLTGTTEMMDVDNIDCSISTKRTCKLDEFVVMKDMAIGSQCRHLLKTAECVNRVEEKCHFNDRSLESSRKDLAMIKSMCGTTLEEGARGRSECTIHALIDDMRPCRKRLVKYARALINEGLISDVIDAITLNCIRELTDISCIAVRVEKNCGKMAYDEYMELYELMPDAGNGCRSGQFQDLLPTMLQLFKESERAETLLRNVFKTMRFRT